MGRPAVEPCVINVDSSGGIFTVHHENTLQLGHSAISMYFAGSKRATNTDLVDF